MQIRSLLKPYSGEVCSWSEEGISWKRWHWLWTRPSTRKIIQQKKKYFIVFEPGVPSHLLHIHIAINRGNWQFYPTMVQCRFYQTDCDDTVLYDNYLQQEKEEEYFAVTAALLRWEFKAKERKFLLTVYTPHCITVQTMMELIVNDITPHQNINNSWKQKKKLCKLAHILCYRHFLWITFNTNYNSLHH